MKRLLLVLVLLLAANAGRVQASGNIPETKFVRVAVLDDITSLEVTLGGNFTLSDPATATVLKEGRRLTRSTVAPAAGGLRVGDQMFPVKMLEFSGSKDVTIFTDGRENRYRGVVDIRVKDNGKLLVVNVVGLEHYVRGVLYHEVSNRWPMEATKAQAVAIRTYAVHEMIKNKAEPFDVTGDIFSQVYGGRSAERFRTNLAADKTRGEILLYQGEVLPAYYSASCGGHTESAKYLWGNPLPPLRGVVCNFCRNEPNFTWTRNYQSSDIQRILNKHGYKLGLIKEIRILARNASGRVQDLKIIDRNGKGVVMSGAKFRDLIGPNRIRSTNFTVVMKGYYFDLVGKGWGHGVGLCQWGAYAMSKEHYDYKQILAYYYPGTELVNYMEPSEK